MKKHILYFLLLIALCLPLSISAQDFKFGLQFGITPSQVDGDGLSGYNKIGLTGGAFVSRDLTDNIFLLTDLSYTMKGSRVASSKNVDFSQIELTTNYIDWGIYAGYRFTNKVDLKLGLMPSVLIHSNESTASGFELLEQNSFRPVNLLISGGLHYRFSTHFFLNATYNYSIISIRPGEYEIFNYDVKVSNAQYHHYINLSLMYRF